MKECNSYDSIVVVQSIRSECRPPKHVGVYTSTKLHVRTVGGYTARIEAEPPVTRAWPHRLQINIIYAYRCHCLVRGEAAERQ